MFSKQTSAPAPLLVDTHDACVLLSTSARTLWQLTKDGIIPCRRLGRSVRYSIRDLEAWIDAGCPRNAAKSG